MGLNLFIKICFKRKIQTLTLGARALHLHSKRYWPEAITKILWPYTLKDFVEQLNALKVDDDGITPMDNSACTRTDITIKITTYGYV